MQPITAKAVSEIKQPINRFSSVAEMNVCMLEWQKTLSLSDWIFYPALGSNLDDGNVAQNDFTPSLKAGKITIRRPSDPNCERFVVKCPEEKALVHELLHAKIIYEEDSTNGLHFHQAIEDLAKALVATKYGLPISWFDNTKDDPELYPEKAEKK
jgi:hypothetical protein